MGKRSARQGGQIIPAGLDLRNGYLSKYAAQGRGDHALVRFGDALQQVAGKLHPAALPDAALQLPADRLGQARVGIGDHQLDAIEPPLLEVGDELRSEGLALAVAHLEAEQLTAAPILVHPHGDDNSAGADLLSLAKPPFEVGRAC